MSEGALFLIRRAVAASFDCCDGLLSDGDDDNGGGGFNSVVRYGRVSVDVCDRSCDGGGGSGGGDDGGGDCVAAVWPPMPPS